MKYSNHLLNILNFIIKQEVNTTIRLESTTLSNETLEVILMFLSFFNIGTVFQEGEHYGIKLHDEASIALLKSLTTYLENHLHINPNWDKNINEQGNTTLKNGRNFIKELESLRTSFHANRKHLDEVSIALCIVKAQLQSKTEPYYLMQFNSKTLMYQFIGGYLTHNEDLESGVKRFLKKELPSLELEDLKIEHVHDPIETYNISPKTSLFTKYTINLNHIMSSISNVKLSPIDRWITLEELKTGQTFDGIAIKSIFQDVEDKDRRVIAEHLTSLPYSISQTLPLKNISKHSAASIEHQETNKIQELLKLEESSVLEFKSSVRWDMVKNEQNKGLEKIIIKTIAAFLNSDGGTLIIGVADNKTILGLQNDINTLQKKNEDGLMQHLITLFTTKLGIQFVPFIDIHFHLVDNKTIATLTVHKATQPVFLKEGELREFYIRAANTSRLLNSEEVFNYIQMHW